MAGITKYILPLFSACGLFLFVSLAQSPSARAEVFSPRSFTLSNGMQVVIVPNRLSMAVTQMVWYKAGAADEAAGKSGVAHYLEHMMFRGTENVPAGAFSEIVAAQGGTDNAFTAYDHTAYYETVAADRLALVMQLEADRMRNLSLHPETAATELNVVLSERQERTGNSPQGIFHEKLRAALFPDHPYGIPVIGKEDEVADLSPRDLREFYESFYHPANAVVVISGNVDVEKTLSLASAAFGRIPAGKNAIPTNESDDTNRITSGRRGAERVISKGASVHTSNGMIRKKIPRSSAPTAKRVEMKDARVRQPSVYFSYIEASYSTQKRNEAYALEVLNEALDGGEVGILHNSLVVKKRVAGAINIYYDPQSRGDSVFSISATPANGVTIEKLEQEIIAELQKTAKNGVSAKEISAAKKRLVDSAVFARDSLMAPCQILGAALTTGQSINDIESWPDKIGAVSANEVNAALRKLINNERFVVGILAPEDEEGGEK